MGVGWREDNCGGDFSPSITRVPGNELRASVWQQILLAVELSHWPVIYSLWDLSGIQFEIISSHFIHCILLYFLGIQTID